jgi:arylsulfatase A-like enzyme
MKKLFTALLLALPAAAPALPPSAPRGVIFLDICSARADHFGAYGYKRPTTPNIDAMAGEAAVFENAVSMSSWCLPNYASLFTGHTPEVHGQYVSVPYRGMPSFETTLAQKMRAAGYETAAFSGGIYFMRPWGLDRGFDTYVNVFSTTNAAPGTFAQTMPGVMEWLDAKKGKPFFLFLAVDDLHVPFQSTDPEMFDPGYEGMVNDPSVRSVPFFRDYNSYMRGELPKDATNYARVAAFAADKDSLKHLNAKYDAALHTSDKRVGEFIAYLKKNGFWDSSVFILSADHGEQLGEHALLGHTEGLYEPITRVPLIMHAPGDAPAMGKRLPQLVERVDMMPTILDLAGINYEDLQLQGKSLAPLLADPALPFRQYAYSSNKRNLPGTADQLIDERVIRDSRWKLHWYLYKNGYELYDLKNDPLETTDVSSKEPEVLKRLSFELLKKVEQTRPHAPGLPADKGPNGIELTRDGRTKNF